MSRKNDFEDWLTAIKNFDTALCKKYISTLNILDSFFKRKGYGLTFLFEENQIQISEFLTVFENNDELRKQDKKKNGIYSTALSLLIEYVKGKESLPEISDDINKAKDIPEPPKELAMSAMDDKRTIAKTPKEKLIRRIEREFVKCRYIGDILISEEEYAILKELFRARYEKIVNSYTHSAIDRVFAVALVQIGARFYNGSYWPHVQKELGIDRMPATHQAWIGNSFFETLTKYDKYRVDENQFVNNILLHCFITEYYANDLFDFLFAYYQLDLERDLNKNTKEMRDYLMQAMLKSDTSARAYKIRKHTADAVLVNNKGCRIRVSRILRFIDNALFNDILPIESQNRIAQLFCKWASSSQRFDFEKKRVKGMNKHGEKRFTSPYIHYDGRNERFVIILPQQYIRLLEDEDLPDIGWRIIIDDDISYLPVQAKSVVTGCRTEKYDQFELKNENLFCNVEIELWKNNKERIRRFKIKEDSIRFFDKDWDMVEYESSSKFLPIGQVFAFSMPECNIESSSEIGFDVEIKNGMKLFNMFLSKGDVLRLPNGKAKSVGRILEEGILDKNRVEGAYILYEEQLYSIDKSLPSIFIKMRPDQENGTLIVINNQRIRFDVKNCIVFDIDEKVSDIKGYIINLEKYIKFDGIYKIVINIPNCKKDYSYSFAYVNGFEYEFEDAPYIYVTRGTVKLSDNIEVCSEKKSNNNQEYDFEISTTEDYIRKTCILFNKKTEVLLSCPSLKWRFDDDNWQILSPKDIWHRNFPKQIEIKYPDDKIDLYMTADDFDEEKLEEDGLDNHIEIEKSKTDGIFRIDTRRLLSWVSLCPNECVFHIKTSEQDFSFFNVLTKNQIESVVVSSDADASNLIINAEIKGEDKTVADIYLNYDCIAKKIPIENGTAKVSCNVINGWYVVIFYSVEEDDFGDGLEYNEICKKACKYINPNDMTGRSIQLVSVMPSFNNDYGYSNSTLELLHNREYVVVNLKRDENNKMVYYGDMYSKDGLIYKKRVKVEFFDKTDLQKAWITFEEFEDDWTGFYYDSVQKIIVSEPDKKLSKSSQYRRYKDILFSEDYYYKIAFVDTELIDLSKYKQRKEIPLNLVWKNSPPNKEQKIEDQNFSVRTLNSLTRAGLMTLEIIIKYGTENLIKVRNLGQKGCDEILKVLREKGYIK